MTSFDQLDALASEWTRIWNANPKHDVFAKPAWARAWWQAFGVRSSLCAPAVFNGDRLLGILPVIAEGRTLRFLGTPHSDYCDLLCEPDARVQVLEKALAALYDLQSSWDRCVLENVSETSNIMISLPQLPDQFRSRMRLVYGCPCPTLLLDDQRHEVLASILRKDSLRRHYNTLRNKGHLTFRHVQDRAEITFHLPMFFRQHIARRAIAGSWSMFSREDGRAFYHALVDQLDPATELRFSVLELDDRPIAYHLGFESQSKFIWYKPTFDIDIWKLSPGEVLFKCLLEYIAPREVREFDFTRGREKFKDRFSNHIKNNYVLHLYPAGTRGRMIHLWERAEDQAKIRLERSSGVLLLIKSAASRVKRNCLNLHAALQRHGLLAMSRDWFGNAFRKIVFSRDNVLIFSSDRQLDRTPESNLVIQPGTLSELATLSAESPLPLNEAQLQEARHRLESGDQVYIARNGKDVPGLLWMGIRSVVTESEAGFPCRIPLGEPANLVYDFWTPSAIRPDGIYTRMLRGLRQVASEEGRQIWMCCRGNDLALRAGIEEAGFSLRDGMTRIQVFRRFSWTFAA